MAAARVEYSDHGEGECKSNLLENLHSLWQLQKFCDVEILVDGSIVKAHRVILSAGSKYFKAMFTCGLAEKTTQSIEMKSMKLNILQLLVDFIYTGNMKITVENAQELIAAANMLIMSRAIRVCTDFLKSELHPSNALGIYRGYMDFYNPMHDLLSYNPVTGEWRALAGRAPPLCNYTMGVVVLNNFLYLVGGQEETSLERNPFEQNKWFKCSPMNFDRSIPAVVATNSLLYVIGGHRQNDLSRLVETTEQVARWQSEESKVDESKRSIRRTYSQGNTKMPLEIEYT
ncbi:actin-binding protein IPP-like, partial [Homarus americanus]|uniref:actin-binding protein IPP-like n=1 Tax=Homarus americanus TaxID=6706 RepID=UPI001C4815FA